MCVFGGGKENIILIILLYYYDDCTKNLIYRNLSLTKRDKEDIERIHTHVRDENEG